jgi:hypothetical protein
MGDFNEYIIDTKVNYRDDYPKAEGTRCTIGNLPTSLYGEIMELVEITHMTTPMVVAAMFRFAMDNYTPPTKGKK